MHKDKLKTGASTKEYRKGYNRIDWAEFKTWAEFKATVNKSPAKRVKKEKHERDR